MHFAIVILVEMTYLKRVGSFLLSSFVNICDFFIHRELDC